MSRCMNPVILVFLAFALVLSCICGVRVAFAKENLTTVMVEFVGENKEKAGFAECEITITPGENAATKGYYLVYYTDGQNLLSQYEEVLAIPMSNGDPVTGTISAGIMFPAEAKGLAVFEHTTYYCSFSKLDIVNAVASVSIPEEKLNPDLGKKLFSFGALSDTHMNYEQHSRGAYKKLEDSMNFFAEMNMDMVLISGDVTGDRGESPDLEAQYAKHVEIINGSNFPFENVYEAIGNHGNTPSDVALLSQYLANEKEEHPYENSPYFHVLMDTQWGNDNLFIFMAQELYSPGESASYDNFSEEQMDWVEGLFHQYGETNTNIFVVLHSPFLKYGAGDVPKGTYNACITFDEDYVQTMRLKALLENYKDTIVMSGHTHVSFYENANYSNVSGTFAHTVHIGSNSQPCAYGEKTSLVKSWDGRRDVSRTYGSEGYTVDVYENYIVYTGYNLSTERIIPAAQFMIPTKPYDGPKEPVEEPEPESKPESTPKSQPETPSQPETCLYGDVDENQVIDAKDALFVLKAAVGKETLTSLQHKCANVNGDESIDATDALLILQKAVYKIEEFPVENQAV